MTPVLEVGGLGSLEQPLHTGEEVRLPHHDLRGALAGGVHALEPGVGQGEELRQPVVGHEVVAGHGVPGADHVPVQGGDALLQLHHPDAQRGGLVPVRADPGQRQQTAGVLGVLLEDLGVGLVPVVGLVRQAQAALEQVQEHAVRVPGVVEGAGVDEAGDALALQSPGQGEQLRGGGHGGHRRQVRGDRLEAAGLHGLVVHERGVQRGDPALELRMLRALRVLLVQRGERDVPVRAGRGRGLHARLGGVEARADLAHGVLAQVPDGELGRVPQLEERAVGALVRGDLMGVQPPGVDVAVQVLARRRDFGLGGGGHGGSSWTWGWTVSHGTLAVTPDTTTGTAPWPGACPSSRGRPARRPPSGGGGQPTSAASFASDSSICSSDTIGKRFFASSSGSVTAVQS